MILESQDLTRGSLWKKILYFSIPLMLSNILQVLFNMSDIAVVGQFAGADALGAVGSTTTLVALFTGFLIGLGSGVNVIVARFFGAGDGRDVPGYLHRCVPCRQKNAVNFLAGNTPGVMASYAPEMNSRQAERALQPTSPTVTPAIRDLAAESDETVERLVEWREQATY